MNFVDSQLLKPLNNYELRISSYEKQKSIDYNLAFLGINEGGRERNVAVVEGEVHDPQTSVFKALYLFLLVSIGE